MGHKHHHKDGEVSGSSSANWGSAPDWANLFLGGLLVVLAAIVDSYTWTWWGIFMGILLILAALWDMSVPSAAAAISQGIVGLVIFLLPWFGSFASASAGWISWTIGILAVICAIWAWAANPNSNSVN